MKRILRAKNDPNLYGLALCYSDIERTRFFINDKAFSILHFINYIFHSIRSQWLYIFN